LIIHIISQAPFGPLLANMTASTKLEVHNVLHCRQKRNEPQPQVTCTENSVKFGHVVFEICERTDRQTDKHTDKLIAIHRTTTVGEVQVKLGKLNYSILRAHGKQNSSAVWSWIFSFCDVIKSVHHLSGGTCRTVKAVNLDLIFNLPVERTQRQCRL